MPFLTFTGALFSRSDRTQTQPDAIRLDPAIDHERDGDLLRALRRCADIHLPYAPMRIAVSAVLMCLPPAPISMPSCFSFAAQQPSDDTANPSRPPGDFLLPGSNQFSERQLKGGESHFYRINLTAGQFLSIDFEGEGADLIATLSGPDAHPLIEVNLWLKDTSIIEPLRLVAEASGTHQLRIRSPEKDAPTGRYHLMIGELRAANPQDKQRIAAERATAQGAQLQHGRGTPEFLRLAIERYQAALLIWRDVRDRYKEAEVLGSLGSAYSSLKEYERAINYYHQEAEILRSIKDYKKEIIVLETIGWLAFDFLKDKQKALGHLEQALSRYQRLGPRLHLASRGGEARLRALVGTVYYTLGETPAEKQKALEYFIEALTYYREVKDRYREGDALSNLMTAYEALGQPHWSIFYGKQAVNVYQEIRTVIKTAQVDEESQKTFLKSKEDTYRTLAQLLIAQGRLPEAQQVLMMLKEEEYFDFVHRDGKAALALLSRADLDEAERDALRRYAARSEQLISSRQKYNSLNLRTSGTRSTAEEAQLAALASELQDANRAFQVFLKQLGDEFGKLDRAAGERTRREVDESIALQEELKEWGPGTVALYVIVSEENYRVIMTTPQGQLWREADPKIKRRDLDELILQFRLAVQNRRTDPRPLAQRLYQILIAPIAKALADAEAKTLIWSLDGTLRYLPIPALHDGKQYFVERYNNVIITLASRTRLGPMPSENWRGLGMGVSKETEGFRPLFAVPEELRSIIRDEETPQPGLGLLPGKVMLDEQFTLQAMRSAMKARYPLVHIASHFSLKPSERESFLLLGGNQKLSLDTIRVSPELFFEGVELLTLSACNTATGTRGNGKEVESFAVLAQKQGARSVLATLWPVADASTQKLMQEFYRSRLTGNGAMRDGVTKAEALRQAQMALLRGEVEIPAPTAERQSPGDENLNVPGADDGERRFVLESKAPYAHPHYWAPFILIGNWK